MSCRVLKRGVEQLLCNYIVEKARKMGIASLRGVFIPTSKNDLVRDHYRSLGFTWVKNEQHNATHWRLEVENYKSFDVPIELVEAY
jgi:predicted enzyme involved in methoxymalonyl-ACP biosynthesis